MKQEIAELEKITNRTTEQEQKLKELKEKLAKLESQPQDSGGGDPKKPTNYLLWIIGGGVVILIILVVIAYLFLKNREDKNGQ